MLAIKCDQASRLAVGAFDDATMSTLRVHAVEKPRQQDCTSAIDSLEPTQIKIERATPMKAGFGALDCLCHRHGMP
jgi:hypothetical protein